MVPQLHWRKVGNLKVRGKAQPESVYEPYRERPSWLDAWEQALSAWEQGHDDEAQRGFRAVDDARGGDGPSQLYLAALDADGVEDRTLPV